MPSVSPSQLASPGGGRGRCRAALAVSAIVLGGALASGAASAFADTDADIVNPAAPRGPDGELHVARLAFANGPQSNWGPGRPWWRIDWPEAELHFLGGVARYTSIDVVPDSVHVTLHDDALFDYPWLIAQQVGRWTLSEVEIRRLREYLERGGFLLVDDFHGGGQWAVFAEAMSRVLPGHRVEELAEDDPLLQVFYALDQRTQIPGRRHIAGTDASGGAVVRMPHSPPRWRGLRDADGRLVVAINFNMDMGDAWEHANDPLYPIAMTSLAYRFGINYLLYAMTH